MQCPHAEGPEELPQVDGTHLSVAMGEASIPLFHLPPSCMALCLAPYLLSTFCLSHVFLLTLMGTLTFQSRRPTPGRVGSRPEVSQLVCVMEQGQEPVLLISALYYLLKKL